MTPSADVLEPPAITDDLIEEAVSRLDVVPRQEGPRRTLFLDVRLPRGAEDIEGPLLFLLRAAAELHGEIQGSDDMCDIEETLEDALRADDRHGIDEGCDIYRSLLASRLKAIWRGRHGEQRLAGLSAAQTRAWSA
jgi:hypothetical protein